MFDIIRDLIEARRYVVNAQRNAPVLPDGTQIDITNGKPLDPKQLLQTEKIQKQRAEFAEFAKKHIKRQK